MAARLSEAKPSAYRVGDWVRVKSAAEIAATLDENGCLEGLPFMPEMVALAERRLRVRAAAHKTCDGLGGPMRRMNRAVHLDSGHCDGAAHGGCQARCLLFFKDAWLEPAGDGGERAGGEDAGSERAVREDAGGETPGTDRVAGDSALRDKAARSVRLRGRDPSRGSFSCQSTEMLNATDHLPIWEPRQYWEDIRSGNITLAEFLHRLPVMTFNVYQLLSRRFLPRRLWLRGGRSYPNTIGTLERTPDLDAGIAPGETVEIRSHAEILATLDTRGTNRGLGLSGDMVRYCGTRAIVHHRVERRLDEHTGELRHMHHPCLVLDGVVCQARLCPRGLDHYWREIWLRRAPASEAPAGPPAPQPLRR